jgi:hypothetical protein
MKKIFSISLFLFLLLTTVVSGISMELPSKRELNKSNRTRTEEKPNFEVSPAASAYTSYDLQQAKDNPSRIILRGVVTYL